MNYSRFRNSMNRAKNDALRAAKSACPVDTGNLRNSIYARDLPNGGFEIYIDTSQADYAIYTTDDTGRKNPNLGWSENVAGLIIKDITIKLNKNHD